MCNLNHNGNIIFKWCKNSSIASTARKTSNVVKQKIENEKGEPGTKSLGTCATTTIETLLGDPSIYANF